MLGSCEMPPNVDDPANWIVPEIVICDAHASYAREMAKLQCETLERLELALRRTGPHARKAPAVSGGKARRKRSDTSPRAAVIEILQDQWGATEPKGVHAYGWNLVNERLKASGRVPVSPSTAKRAWERLYR